MPPLRRIFTHTLIAVTLLLPVATVTIYAQQSKASRKALESAAAKGSAPAQYALGAAAESDGDFAGAASWYQKAAENGYAAAQFKLGHFLEDGQGIPADPAQALAWYRKAAAQQFAPAISRLQVLEPATAAPPAPSSDPTPAPQQRTPAPPVSIRGPSAGVYGEPPTSAPSNPSSTPADRSTETASPLVQSPANPSAVPADDPKSTIDGEELLARFGAFLSLVMLAGVAFYLLPAIIAFMRGHRSRWVIAILNVALGFTLIVWLICLVWAFNKADAPLKGGHKIDPEPADPMF